MRHTATKVNQAVLGKCSHSWNNLQSFKWTNYSNFCSDPQTIQTKGSTLRPYCYTPTWVLAVEKQKGFMCLCSRDYIYLCFVGQNTRKQDSNKNNAAKNGYQVNTSY